MVLKLVYMKKKQKVEYLHPNVLLLVTSKGVLIELFTPIRALVTSQVGKLAEGTNVYIEAIMQSHEHKILYYVMGNWLPYKYFKVGK